MQALWLKYRFLFSVFILIVYYTVGITLLYNRGIDSDLIYLTPFTLLITAFFLFLNHENWSKPLVIALTLIYLLGFFVEVVGVNTGIPFGEYHYTSVLGLQVFNTPLMIGVNWLILVYSAVYMTRQYIPNIYIRSVVAGLILLALDTLIEPVAIGSNMWQWDTIAVPIQNFAAWGVIALLLSLLLNFFTPSDSKNKISSLVILLQFVFFLILGRC